ncbi:MAG: CRISPR-associated helicase Cas3' [Alphaproteobacteria bacterium]|nr:CRISPR-associated helicase Cas3' [Alphaproteobacteria bacterium]
MRLELLGAGDSWGKLSPRDAPTDWHPFEDHCIDVACVGEALASLPTWRDRLATMGLPVEEPGGIDLLGFLLGLHDLGKATPGFQRARNPGVKALGHTDPALMLLHPAFEAPASVRATQRLLCQHLPLHEDDGLRGLLVAAVCHHGRPQQTIDPFAAGGTTWDASDGYEPLRAIAGLLEVLHRAFPRARELAARGPLVVSPSAIHAMCGLAMIADWLGSDVRWFRYRHDREEDRVAFAREQARRALCAMGIDAAPARAALPRPRFADVTGGWAPRGPQATIEDLPLPAGASITILEAATGSGKTEAAMLWYARLLAAGAVDGMYFALPRRTAAIELHGRVVRLAGLAFGDAAPPVTLAVPGYIQMDAATAVALPGYEVRWDDAEMAAGRGWAAERPKRYLAAPVAVGTIDQVLLSGLRTNHAHLRGICLLRQLLVVDEVHASDTYMRKLLRGVLRRHLQSGGHALLLSATLGSEARAELLAPGEEPTKAISGLEEAVSVPYPQVWIRDVAGQRSSTPAPDAQVKNVRVESVRAADVASTMADIAAKAVRSGARVLVIRNLVKDAVETLAQVEARVDASRLFGVGGVSAPHHARFAAEDRELLDRALLASLGREPVRERRTPVVAVTTSTAEQSLDLDADLLVTDLCPMDVLLQRIGRLHRHDADRPEAFRHARCVVVSPPGPLEDRISVLSSGIRGPHGWGTVYSDPRILALTRDEIERVGAWEIPRDNRRLVEVTTHPDALARLAERSEVFERSAQVVMGDVFAQAGQASFVALRWTDSWEASLWTSAMGRPPTRLGMGDRVVEVDGGVRSPFAGERRYRLTIPGWWVEKVQMDSIATRVGRTEEGERVQLGDLSFVYGRKGLQWLR